MKRLWVKYLSLILILLQTSVLFAQFEKKALVLKRELVLNSNVIGQKTEDVLKLRGAYTDYRGEYIKIESETVFFKAQDTIIPQQIKINKIKMLKLSDGTELIRDGRVKRKANETIIIQPGDKIMVEYDTISKSLTGLFSGFNNGEISIQSFDKNQKVIYTIIPSELVANIIILPTQSAVSPVAASCGIIMFALSLLDGFNAEVGLVMAGLGAITGGLVSSVLNNIENQKAFKDSKYTLLGKDAWYIDNQYIK